MKNNKGFTLIELLVVIAIIGILSSVVLASLTTARSKGQAAAIQSELSNMRAQAELYYSQNGNKYGTSTIGNDPGNCSTSSDDLFGTVSDYGLGELIDGVIYSYSGANPKCFVSKTNWSVSATLTDGSFWCVDNTGKSASTTMNTTVPYECL